MGLPHGVRDPVPSGVRLASGEEVPAQFVVDTSGGRSRAVAKVLQEKCGQKVESVKFDIGLNYHTRFFKMPAKVGGSPCMLSSKHTVVVPVLHHQHGTGISLTNTCKPEYHPALICHCCPLWLCRT